VTAGQEAPPPATAGPIARYKRSVIDRINDFNDPRQDWRRLFSELLGTFFLVLGAWACRNCCQVGPGFGFADLTAFWSAV
jgi:glycerol uptake facilitator-like aquaporin